MENGNINTGLDGWGGMLGLIVLLGLFNGGLFGGNANTLAAQQYATRDQVQNGFDTQNLQMQTQGILSAVSNGTASGIAATKEAGSNNLFALKDVQVALTGELGRLETMGANILAKLNECCCNLMRGLDSVKYDNLQNTNTIMGQMNAGFQRIAEMITRNREADMQNQINRLELAQAMAGVVRWPSGWCYPANWPVPAATAAAG